MNPLMETLAESLDNELHNILNYWSANSIDEINGGFVGERDHFNQPIQNATKGIILNSRLLWTFSAVSNHFNSDDYFDLCKRSYEYLRTYFNDEKQGGVYWELNEKGTPINTRKQVYAQAFMIYALTEYYKYSNNQQALDWAIELFDLIEKYAFDRDNGGYIEAFNNDWSPIDDMRLSEKDENVEKSLNTHLHILEAYTNLYRVYQNEKLKKILTDLCHLFLSRFINNNNQLNLFFDKKWNSKGKLISYGHDIEAAWLLEETCRMLNDKKLISASEKKAIAMADTFIAEGIDKDFGVMYEYDPETGKMDSDKHWWVQAEALNGLYCAYELSKDDKYLQIASKIWEFIDLNIIDKSYGEWIWKLNENGSISKNHYKVGMWKAPYHNVRTCLKLIK